MEAQLEFHGVNRLISQ